MFGCLRRAGCLVVLFLLVAGGWMTRDLWWERVTGHSRGPGPEFVPLEAAAAPAARLKVERLDLKEGEAFVSLTAAEAGALVLAAGGTRLSSSLQDVQASVADQVLIVRASVDLRSLRGVEALGPLAALLTARQWVTIRGIPRVVGPAQGRFDIDGLKIGAVDVPAPALRTVVAQLDREAVPSGSSRPSISFSLPLSVGDIRVAGDRVILYKRAP